ncbi:DNA-3-methyladenine glycosylase I [Candidatus Gracilibacteria bacterium]|nr:DNA-3-methyladenine glycosylase I [Candidatus Gracilibacteria bacterium]
MKPFNHFHTLAIQRKGGEKNLQKLLTPITALEQLAQKPDSYYLEWMTRCIFNAGFYWGVITKKWPDFKEAFLDFDIETLLFQDEDFWINLCNDTRIVRHRKKIAAVRANLSLIADIRLEYGSFANWIAQWPSSDQAGLLWELKKRGSRLGGRTGQYFLRFTGKDSFILSPDMALALRHAGLDIAEEPSSKRDMTIIQNHLNTWHTETGLSYTHMSKILAYSCGTNNDTEVIVKESGKWEGKNEPISYKKTDTFMR